MTSPFQKVPNYSLKRNPTTNQITLTSNIFNNSYTNHLNKILIHIGINLVKIYTNDNEKKNPKTLFIREWKPEELAASTSETWGAKGSHLPESCLARGNYSNCISVAMARKGSEERNWASPESQSLKSQFSSACAGDSASDSGLARLLLGRCWQPGTALGAAAAVPHAGL